MLVVNMILMKLDDVSYIGKVIMLLKITKIHNLCFQYYKKKPTPYTNYKNPTYTQNVMYMSVMLCILIGRESKVIKKMEESVITSKMVGIYVIYTWFYFEKR